jgi:ERCC4-related helicase
MVIMEEKSLFWADQLADRIVNREKFHYTDEKVPKLEKFLRNYRRKISDRVGIFEKVRKELKNIKQVLSSSEQSQDDVFIIGNEELRTPIADNGQQTDSHPQA